MNHVIPKLLVSVTSALEAEAALAGGADVIDVKDPSRGALGRADGDVIDAVRAVLAGRRPVSAALGELCEFLGSAPAGVDYVKCGLAGLAGAKNWQGLWGQFREAAGRAQAVVVAYADWQCAKAPPLDAVRSFACRCPGSILLVDTACKERTLRGRPATLCDWLPFDDIAALICEVHRAAGQIALAGSLGLAEIDGLRHLGPDWIAVRGAACRNDDRDSTVDPERVRGIKTLLGTTSEN
jgi:uncharacterized protein (UPF0264 family)